jgi:hypothetical protein
MVTLAANGCVLWSYADYAAKRARVWADTYIRDPYSYHGNGDPLFNEVYGTYFPGVNSTGENFLVASAWLASGSADTWPAR